MTLLISGATQAHDPKAAPLPISVIGAVNPTAEPAGSASSAGGRPDAPLSAARGPRPSQTPTPQPGMTATSLRIPDLGVTGSIDTAAIVKGVLTPPRVPMEVGAWAGSAGLDATAGAVTLTGRVNRLGPAPFAFGRLASLQPGDIVYTTDAEARQTARRITTVEARPTSAGIDQAAFTGIKGPRTLGQITCGGPFNSADESFDDNVYVQAKPM